MNEMATVSVRRLAELKDQGKVDLIDVRTTSEYRELHAEIAKNVPLESLQPRALMEARNGSADEPLYVICRSGSRSTQACKKFIESGYDNVISVDGGTEAWNEAGLPVVRGKKAVSLERQVRIAAGFLVLLGAVLSFWSIYFVLLSGFVGAGLMFAGITDTCGMAMVLAKMPWNQVKNEATCSAS